MVHGSCRCSVNPDPKSTETMRGNVTLQRVSVITDSGLMNRVFELNQYRGKPFRSSTWRSQRAISELAIVDRVKFEV